MSVAYLRNSEISETILANTAAAKVQNSIKKFQRNKKIDLVKSKVKRSEFACRFKIDAIRMIFLLAVIGNTLVILTLVQSKRMRTITNLFLLNLAISDLFLGVFCMPFTLVGMLLRDFIFGELMCKLLPYLQATSVSVSAWTLVAISVERYYAICHPLRSRRWQTLKHAYKTIIIIWLSSLMLMLPIAILSKLIPTSQGHNKCREVWPNEPLQYEKMFNIFLDLILLVVPLSVLGAAYFLISSTLCQSIGTEKKLVRQMSDIYSNHDNIQGSSRRRQNMGSTISFEKLQNSSQEMMLLNRDVSKKQTFGLRRSNPAKSLLNKKRVIKMLFVVVLEFFICWTPLYVINTIALFDPKTIYQNLGYTAISFFQLLAYSSSCCNPITYCFMNIGFRKAFVNLFRCFRHEPSRRISVSGYCITSLAGSAEAQILAATVNSLMQNETSSNCLPLSIESYGEDLNFLEPPLMHSHSSDGEKKDTNFSQ